MRCMQVAFVRLKDWGGKQGQEVHLRDMLQQLWWVVSSPTISLSNCTCAPFQPSGY